MKFIYNPAEGSDHEPWEVEFDLERPRLTAAEGKFIESEHDGKPLPDLFEAAQNGSITVMLTILFVFRKRAVPTLRYQDFEDAIILDDLEVELEDDEQKALDEADPKDPSPDSGDETPASEENGTSPSSS